MPETRNQKMAQTAFERVSALESLPDLCKEYASFAKSFPALIHNAGLAQAYAFALAKAGRQDFGRAKARKRYANDLALVLESPAGQAEEDQDQDQDQLSACFARKSRSFDVVPYLRLSREALGASMWIRRYVEALGLGDDDKAASHSEPVEGASSPPNPTAGVGS